MNYSYASEKFLLALHEHIRVLAVLGLCPTYLWAFPAEEGRREVHVFTESGGEIVFELAA